MRSLLQGVSTRIQLESVVTQQIWPFLLVEVIARTVGVDSEDFAGANYDLRSRVHEEKSQSRLFSQQRREGRLLNTF